MAIFLQSVHGSAQSTNLELEILPSLGKFRFSGYVFLTDRGHFLGMDLFQSYNDFGFRSCNLVWTFRS